MIRTPLRTRVDLSSGWSFRLGPVDKAWLGGAGEEGGTAVRLPRCWNEKDAFQYGVHSFCGEGSYRRSFSLPHSPAGSGSWLLRSEGFYGLAEIWLDGRRVSRTDGQYLGFSIPLPSMAEGTHLLAVSLDNRIHRNRLPGHKNPDFLLYGGLTGRIFLEWAPSCRLAETDIRLAFESRLSTSIPVTITLPILGGGDAAESADLSWSILDDRGRQVAQSSLSTLEISNAPLVHTCRVEVTEARTWSPDDPRLYVAEGRLRCGDAVDVVCIRFGFRDAVFRPREGFFLNGERLELHGCNRHESIPGLGAALPPEIQRRDAETLKSLGCNFVRLSHYPQHPTFLDACDELGLLVYPEIATWKSVRSSARWRRAAVAQMQAMVRRDRHRPSIIVWGMGNESRSRKAYTELAATVRTLDPTRPTIYAENHLYRARRKKTVGLPDVWGTNYELDVLYEAAASSRLGNVIVSECCNHPHSVKGDDEAELTQLRVIERDWADMAGRPYVAGYAVWCLTDYATEHRDRFRRLAGLCDAWRRPKMAAQLFRARHADEAFVSLHLTAPALTPAPSPYRLEVPPEDGATPDRDLHVFTNCDAIRLSRKGRFVGEYEGVLHYVFGLEGEAGPIEVIGHRGGEVVVKNLIQPGPAERLNLSAPEDAAGCGRTFAVDVDVVDEDGELVPTWNGAVGLGLEGPARLRAFTPEDTAEIGRGEGRIYITCDEVPAGTIEIEAHGEGLEPSTARFSW